LRAQRDELRNGRPHAPLRFGSSPPPRAVHEPGAQGQNWDAVPGIACALAVFEILELLRDALCAAYGPEIQQAFRDDLMLEQGSLPLGPGEPF
jgi:hypothetical protein